MLAEVKNRVSKMLSSGYDAIAATGKRKAASSILKHEDNQLKSRDRRQMVGYGRELIRNYSVVSWVIRKHLDYCTQFDFQVRTDSDELNQQIEDLVKTQMRPVNCDQAGRHTFPRMLRMAEARRTIDGDFFLLKRNGTRLQGIEGDLIQNPDEMERDALWFNGCHVNRDGRALEWALHRRMVTDRYEFQKKVPARNLIQHANFDSTFRFDQVRGISPLACAFNSFRDLYEGVDFALAKLKVEQLFAMVITDGATDGVGDHEKASDGYNVDFGKGPVKLELEPGEDAKFLKTDNPGSSTQSFLHLVMGMALKSLDVPFSFYSENFTNFYGSKAAFMQYDRSCHAKRADVLETLRKITVWWLQNWIRNGLLRLPSGMGVNDVPFEWVPRGMPWWDPAKEIKGDVLAIGAGLDNPYRICKERGRGEYEDNIREIARAQNFAESQGVNVSFTFEETEQVDDVDKEMDE